jgi:hypothetical protein
VPRPIDKKRGREDGIFLTKDGILPLPFLSNKPGTWWQRLNFSGLLTIDELLERIWREFWSILQLKWVGNCTMKKAHQSLLAAKFDWIFYIYVCI